MCIILKAANDMQKQAIELYKTGHHAEALALAALADKFVAAEANKIIAGYKQLAISISKG